MAVVIITGSAGLVGSEAASFFCEKGFDVVGIDNNFRRTFFGDDACTEWNRQRLEKGFSHYRHESVDIRDAERVGSLFEKYKKNISLIIHAAAQPSHDWAASNPFVDFTINANGTLVMLENVRKYCPEAVFVFCSTNKVYGDLPNSLPLVEKDTRWELDSRHKWFQGVDETMPIDQSMHSLFGVSKTAADLLVQEYGRYFQIKTGVFRGGCLTGPNHSGTQLHGFLSYLMRCCISGKRYVVYGYKGKQVRDNIHSSDLIHMFWHFYRNPRYGEVYNVGGSRQANCSVLEAITMCQEISGRALDYEVAENNRAGDHIWWISSISKFREHFPEWEFKYDIKGILREIHDMQKMVV